MWIKKRPRKLKQQQQQQLSKNHKNESKGDRLGKVPYL